VELVAETTTGCLLSAGASEDGADKGDGEGVGGGGIDGSRERARSTPEEVGRRAAGRLAEEARRGGCVDSGHQPLALILAALGPAEAQRIRMGPLTPGAVRTLRLLRDALGVRFALQAEEETGTVLLTCVGTGTTNVARKARL